MSAADLVARIARRRRSNFTAVFSPCPVRRDALYAVYAFCRTVDDIADVGQARGEDPAALRRALAGWRQEVARCYAPDGVPEHPIARQLQVAVRAFPIPREALEAIVEGVESDLDRRTYETAEELYVLLPRGLGGGAMRRRDLRARMRARQYAVDLGIALQLTNIVRDVGADAQAGRVYLPQEDLRAFGVTDGDLREGRYGPAFVRLMEREAERARSFYRAAWASYPPADARSLVPAEIMGRIYFALLQEIERRRYRVLGGRVALPARRKVSVALGCWLRARYARAA